MNLHRLTIAAMLSVLAVTAGEEEARRVLAAKCWACHGPAAMGGLRLDSRDAMRRGAKSGPAVVPGNAAASRMIEAVTGTNPALKRMPPGAPLTAAEIAALREWVDAGAAWSGGSSHWAFQPLTPPSKLPASIDAAIDASIAKRGLTANPQADKRTFIRRLYFDLVGIVPSPEEFRTAFNDTSSDWAAKLADRLLASPHYGEKWGRHWLDVARFGEDDFHGTQSRPYPQAWRFRDWVIEQTNRDLPYDQFLRAQLAGDTMADKSMLGGTGLMGLGPWYYGISQPPQARADERHDRVDMVSRGMMGVTLGCARCHDHKYDAFTQRDYYALSGVFASSRYREYPLVPEAEAAAWDAKKKELDEAEKALDKFVAEQSARLSLAMTPRIADYMLAATGFGDGANREGLVRELIDQWCSYLSRPEEFHPFLKTWFEKRTPDEARRFAALLAEIVEEKKALDEENRKTVEAAQKVAVKPKRTIVLPFGYRSDEDFNPGADIPIKSLERDRYVAFHRTFTDRGAPMKLDEALTAKLLTGVERAEYDKRKARRDALKKALPEKYPYLDGMTEWDAWDLPLDKRGNPEDPGEVIPRQFPPLLSGGTGVPLRDGSGRVKLAQLVGAHPLTARVAVNRIWMHLFGEGIVRTPSNFGVAGDRPGNPELLEYLAARFVALQYSQKALIREIVLSNAYQRSADANAANASDAANRSFWRQNRRRLDAEPLRDSMLAASGLLDRRVGGESQPLAPEFRRRTVYARVGRFQQDETLSLFDLPAAAVTCEQRVVTTVPLQKLFFLNSDAVAVQAKALGERLRKARGTANAVRLAYDLLFQRAPTEKELSLGTTFLAAKDKGASVHQQYAQVLLSSNEFSYVD